MRRTWSGCRFRGICNSYHFVHRDGINTDFVCMFMLYLLLNCDVHVIVSSFSVLLLPMSSVLFLMVSFRFLFYSLYLIILVSVVSLSILFLFIVSDCSIFDGLILDCCSCFLFYIWWFHSRFCYCPCHLFYFWWSHLGFFSIHCI